MPAGGAGCASTSSIFTAIDPSAMTSSSSGGAAPQPVAQAAMQIVRVAPAAHMADADGDALLRRWLKQHQPKAAEHLDQRQHCRSRRIVVKAQRTVDSQLDRGGFRAAAQRARWRSWRSRA